MHGGRRPRHARRPVGEALGMRAVRDVEGGLTYGSNLGDAAVEDIGRCEQGEPCVMVVVVVPGEEVAEPRTPVEKASEAARVVGLVLHGLEAGLRQGVRPEGEVRDEVKLARDRRADLARFPLTRGSRRDLR